MEKGSELNFERSNKTSKIAEAEEKDWVSAKMEQEKIQCNHDQMFKNNKKGNLI